MIDNWLSPPWILSIGKDCFQKLNFENIISNFTLAKTQKLEKFKFEAAIDLLLA